ncbi:T9SS type A sorting domain-containing protein [Puia sp. P3]|uniref:T9SS type A sorting domain-containing protein n=1 Tax=Puia sp. P3 TaxID=3423952 RepID=UPI003D6659F7
MLLYPNPAKDFITIQSTQPDITGLTLYDATGREMLRQTFSGSAFTLPLTNMSPGLYYIILRSPDGTQRQYPVVHVK